ncbi:MAG: hypothetical protein DI533_10835 [Cereibacter sphaeroides]|uniref:L-ectoine synthase n=1 Tax=Cereibacter sphaeroides TaxID=1063 RepID=A0A2W5U2V3_CERSP|nr:MAG: hypothetical protein DI533_10835 [Cereibacter sphaeroides]
MAADDTTVDLSHAHDCVYYVSNGSGRISDLTVGSAQELIEGSIVHIDGGDRYRLEAGSDGMRVVGGPVPADPALYEEFAVKVAE